MTDPTRYLVIVQLHNAEPSRLINLVPALQSQLNSLSQVAPEQAFRSVSADLFGYFISTKLAPRQITAAIQSPGGREGDRHHTILEGKDALFVIEVGAGLDATAGFTRAATWLQRH